MEGGKYGSTLVRPCPRHVEGTVLSCETQELCFICGFVVGPCSRY